MTKYRVVKHQSPGVGEPESLAPPGVGEAESLAPPLLACSQISSDGYTLKSGNTVPCGGLQPLLVSAKLPNGFDTSSPFTFLVQIGFGAGPFPAATRFVLVPNLPSVNVITGVSLIFNIVTVAEQPITHPDNAPFFKFVSQVLNCVDLKDGLYRGDFVDMQ